MSKLPTFRLVDRGWKEEFALANKLASNKIAIISPFIKLRALRQVTNGQKTVRVLTRYSLSDFEEGVSDLSALQYLLEIGAEVRGIKNLHAKMYLFGLARAIVTSANLTEAALTRNHELGFVTDEPSIIENCDDYFERLWTRHEVQKTALTPRMLKAWAVQITPSVSKQGSPQPSWPDYGAEIGLMPDPPAKNLLPVVNTRAFVKFFGTGANRANRSNLIIHEVAGSESHWALAYPNKKRPRQVGSGDVMFISCLVGSPDDALIYGRAIAYEHQPGRDDASSADIVRKHWKKNWGTYIRVREPEFIAGTLENGISLRQLMNELGAESFVSTDENLRNKSGNTNPRIALRSKAHMPLTQTAADWLNTRFYQALVLHGRISIAKMEKLHWPPLPVG